MPGCRAAAFVCLHSGPYPHTQSVRAHTQGTLHSITHHAQELGFRCQDAALLRRQVAAAQEHRLERNLEVYTGGGAWETVACFNIRFRLRQDMRPHAGACGLHAAARGCMRLHA